MKKIKSSAFLLIMLIIVSCGTKDKKTEEASTSRQTGPATAIMPVDKGFSEYIAGFTSGLVPASSVIEIRFTQAFAATAKKVIPSGLFMFEPQIKGKAEWTDDYTLVFRPAKNLEPGKIYTGELALYKLGEVKQRLQLFPLRLQTIRKDFSLSSGFLECTPAEPSVFILNGEITTSDLVEASEAESWLTARLERKSMNITWDHTGAPVHKFTIQGIQRDDKPGELVLQWDGSKSGVKQKGSQKITIPPKNVFGIIGVESRQGDNQKIDIIFSDPVDNTQELEGLVYTEPSSEINLSINNNIITVIPSAPWQAGITLNVEKTVRNSSGTDLSSSLTTDIDFTTVDPSIEISGKGMILPDSRNLILPFKAAGLKAVDLTIIKIFENNLPYFLQDNEIYGGYNLRRFGRPVYAGRIDLTSGQPSGTGGWKLYTIDISDYIDVEPGVVYKLQLGMRKSYSLTGCPLTEDEARYEELLDKALDLNSDLWGDPEDYYDEALSSAYYSFGFSWRERNDPCKQAYYSPDRSPSRNFIASNIGLIAKKGEDNLIHIITNDLMSALPLAGVSVDVLDFQLQLIGSGTSDQDGSLSVFCGRKPFLIVAGKDADRNYLKINDGNSLSLSSFDVSGTKPDNGIKAFIYGERDVWRPGDSIFLSVIIRDMKSDLPPDHPVQFELINPLEQRVDNQIIKPEGSNFIVVTSKTSADAPTGAYKAVFRIGGATFTKRVRVETIKPNRLKINLQFPAGVLGGSSGKTTGNLNVKWLNGSLARNLKTSVEYILKPLKTEFEKYSQYVFDDPVSSFYAETVNIFDREVDENGNAAFTFDPGDDLNAPGMLNAVFTVKVSERGGDESITQTTAKYAPYSVFAGINLPGLKGKERMLFTDAENEVKIVTVDEKGRPVKSEVEIAVYKLTYRWWWESDEENLAYFISGNRYRPVVSETISTAGGEGTFRFTIARKDWGRYLIRATTPGGHSTGKIILIDWPWEYGMKANVDGATLLSISTDREKYAPGDEIKLSFPSPENARAIITLENATGIVDEIRVTTDKANTEVTLKAKPEMAPNVYAFVTLIQPHSQTVNDMPVRLYGIVPVMVEDPGTRLQPVITSADEVRSQQSFEIKVSEAGRKEMTYTVAVVDEGLLDITGFKTPDPWNYFYAREALGVQTWDLYDLVLGAFGGTLEKAFATGGDDALADRSAGKAKRFIPVVKFLGPFRLGQGKTNTHSISLPRYTGSVKTMVIAGNERSYGAAEKSVLVKDPMMVLVTAPRVLSPGEKAALPVTLFIQKENIKEVTLTAEGNDLVLFERNELMIRNTGTGEQDTEFSFTAAERTGTAKIKITATGGGESAVYEMELEIRNPNPAETRAELRVIMKGEKWETSFRPFGMDGTNSARLSVSVMPSVNLEKRLAYLLEYPHGCSEQITSAAFPQLLLNILNENDPETAKRSSANIKSAINQLISRQMINGGIALWPGSMQADTWLSSYSGHFMLEAERLGYNIPGGFRQKWISFQKKNAQEWRFDPAHRYTSNDQAYRLFTLALAGQPDRGAMNRMRETKDIPALSRWLLAAAFATTGREEVASDLLDMRNMNTDPELSNYYYGSQVRDKAIILYTLALLNKHDLALPLLKEICENFNSGSWYSTQSLAWGLFSYMKYIGTISADAGGPAKVGININGEGSDHTLTSKMMWSRDLVINKEVNRVTVVNTGDNPVYATLVQKGVPVVSDVKREEKGLALRVDYYNMEMEPLNHRKLAMGTDFMMVVKVSNNTFAAVENIALTGMVPSGWEIRNTRLFETTAGTKESQFDYRDFRDDRVNTYFKLARGETKTFILILNAAYRGEYFQPALWCEAMYNENCYARIPGEKVTITGE